MDRLPSSDPRSSSAFPLGLSFLMVAALFLTPTPGATQNLLRRIDGFMESARGFQLLDAPRLTTLASGTSAAVSVTLLEGSDYMVVGFCDESCSNLDLALFDETGSEVQYDRLPDAEPILAFSPESSGPFSIQMIMAECAGTACRAAVGVLGRTQERGVPPGEDMAGRLSLFEAELQAIGFTEVGDDRPGVLETDQVTRIPLELEEEREYRIAGVCDQDCFDLDLVLRDPTGEIVASDILEDALPILAFVPDTTADFDLEVIMVGCWVEPCGFRLATFAKGENVGPGGAFLSGDLIFHETYRERLERGDDMLADVFLDSYQVEVQAGQRIVADLRSDDFDVVLRVLDPAGAGEENDDYARDIGHAHMEFLATQDGVYSIQVSSYRPLETGNYVLQIAVVS